MFDTESDNSGRVKGSIKDRLISFLYRKRFKIKLYKNRLIKKVTRVRIVHKKRKIENYHDLKSLGNKVIEIDVKNEKFDFDNYDYYIIEPIKKKGIDVVELNEITKKKQIIDISSRVINDIKKDIKKIEINLNYPKEHKENLDKERINIINGISKLKENLPNIDNNINLSILDSLKVPNNKEETDKSNDIIGYYEKIIENNKNNLEVVKIISNTKFNRQIGSTINNDNKNNSIKNIKVYKSSKEDRKIESKKTIKVLNKFDGYKIRQLKRNEQIVKSDVLKATNIINKMNKEVDKVTKEISKITKTTGYSRMIKSCLRVATGILTLPFSKVNLFNITLGSALINRGLKDLRKGLETKSEIKINYKYEDLSSIIKQTKDKTKLTELLIMDSLKEIQTIKESTYLGKKNIEDLILLENNLNKKLKEIDKLNKKLSKQAERNRIKIKKVKDKKV